mgnify:CR=1 FL=1
MDKIPMTAAGYTALEAELQHCQGVERPRIIQQITEARTHGDLSENAEYHAAKEQQSLNEGRIDELQDKLARADRRAGREAGGDREECWVGAMGGSGSICEGPSGTAEGASVCFWTMTMAAVKF